LFDIVGVELIPMGHAHEDINGTHEKLVAKLM